MSGCVPQDWYISPSWNWPMTCSDTVRSTVSVTDNPRYSDDAEIDVENAVMRATPARLMIARVIKTSMRVSPRASHLERRVRHDLFGFTISRLAITGRCR